MQTKVVMCTIKLQKNKQVSVVLSPWEKRYEVAESLGFYNGYEELVDFIERKKVS